jgi:hypothetical protein
MAVWLRGLGVRHDDAAEVKSWPGKAYRILPGHDAWVEDCERIVGRQRCRREVSHELRPGEHLDA